MPETARYRTAQTFGQTKKKRAWSPLKTTRYGVSARRPKKEPTETTTLRRLRPQQGCPFTGLRHRPTGKCIVSAHTTHTATSVLKPLRALWAN
ncbi:hypothetical protein B0G80_3215 [Paraburkholderia sp. BL6669N2]|nr:hypothetical protein B0G71_3993 [Paraburkholderia sp. BL27I4N3]REG60418.1 hypothetical protein B0G80_3215 [Paraburkholderia sp. BL6669N2]RKR43720.1 hypothetical protein B0G82_1296 [Paraburkholderia sp. BL17N1]TDY24744.1 hypothetical protein B0G81_5186 [Paraburkholderia sp. BL6665CI2N2]